MLGRKPNPCNIRLALASDKGRVLDMVAHFLAETPYGDIMTEDTGVADLFDLAQQLGAVFVAENRETGDLDGMIAVVALEHPVLKRPYADELCLWVEQEARDCGLGDELITYMEGWARTAGLYMAKMVAPAGTNVGRMYERRGYAPVETAYHKRL